MKTRFNSQLIFISMIFFANIVISQRNHKSVSDYDNNIYSVIKVGKQEWFAENLKAIHYNNGDLIEVNDNSTKEIYIDNEVYYTWSVINDSRNVCPDGWRVPTNEDWNYLENKFGGQELAAIDLKVDGDNYWGSDFLIATNYSGFSALPSGYVNELGVKSNVGKYGYWWSSNSKDETTAWGREIGFNKNTVYNGFANKQDGLSIRCMRVNK